MTEAFGAAPWVVGQDEIATLKGMMYASGGEPSYQRILKILSTHDIIRINIEY